MPLELDEVVDKLMEELDTNEDRIINEEEFIAGFSKWLDTSKNQAPNSIESPDETYQVSIFQFLARLS